MTIARTVLLAALVSGSSALAAVPTPDCFPSHSAAPAETGASGPAVCSSTDVTPLAAPSQPAPSCDVLAQDRLVALHRSIRDGGLGRFAHRPGAFGAELAVGEPRACRAG